MAVDLRPTCNLIGRASVTQACGSEFACWTGRWISKALPAQAQPSLRGCHFRGCRREPGARLACRRSQDGCRGVKKPARRRIRPHRGFLTMHRDAAYARRALHAGAAGFVLKHSAPEELVFAVRAAMQGRTFITPTLAAEVIQTL